MLTFGFIWLMLAQSGGESTWLIVLVVLGILFRHGSCRIRNEIQAPDALLSFLWWPGPLPRPATTQSITLSSLSANPAACWQPEAIVVKMFSAGTTPAGADLGLCTHLLLRTEHSTALAHGDG